MDLATFRQDNKTPLLCPGLTHVIGQFTGTQAGSGILTGLDETRVDDDVMRPGLVDDVRAPVFEVIHETGCHHVIIDTGFIQACQDAAASLRARELADYMRETRAQGRRVVVLAESGEVQIRSTAL